MHALIHQLIQACALDAGRAQRLWALSGLHQRPHALLPQLRRGLAALAAWLLGMGLIFWVAANWQDQTRSFKLHLLEAAVLLSVGAALAWPRARTAWLLLATLALGGLLAFIGQTYQTGADPWQLFATWALLALPWTVAARRDGLWALWLLVAGLALALWSGDALFDPLGSLLWGSGTRSLAPPLLWGAIFLLPLALPRLRALRPGVHAAPVSWRLATLMACSAWCTHALWGLFMPGQQLHYFFSAALVLGAAVLTWARRPRDFVVLGLTVLGANVLLIAGLARVLLDDVRGNGVTVVLLLTVLAAVCIGVSGTWMHRLQREEAGS